MFQRSVLAMIMGATWLFPAWGQEPRQPSEAERVQAILDEARSQPVEVFADITFALLDKLSTKHKVAALEEVFERSGAARAQLPLRHAAPAVNSIPPNTPRLILDFALVLDRAHRLNLDALSLRCRAVQALLSIDPIAARKLLNRMPKVKIPRSECKDEFVPDAGIYIETAGAVAERGEFTEEEREKEEPWFLVESAARLAHSSWEIVAAAKSLPRFARTEKEAQILSATLAAHLDELTDPDRAFTSAVRSGALIESVLTASRTLGVTGAPEILPQALRSYLVRHFKAIRCKDSAIANDQAIVFNQAVAGRADITPISAEEAVPAGVGDGAERSKYENDAEFRALWSEVAALGTPTNKNFSASRMTGDWAYRARQALSRIQDWHGVEGQDSVSVFHQKIALLFRFIDMAPAGASHRIAMDEMVALLSDPTILQQSPVEWLDQVKFIIQYFEIFTPEVVRAVSGGIKEFSLSTGLEFWQGLADAKSSALSLYGRIGLLKADDPSPR